MRDVLRAVFAAVDVTVFVYFVVLAAIELALLGAAAASIGQERRRRSYQGLDELFANPFAPAISVLVPAFNEEATVVDSVEALLQLRYPMYEVVVVDDGSKDATFDRLATEFDLVASDREVRNDVVTIGAVLSVHVARRDQRLIVVRKENAGRRADALNVALNVARHPLVSMVDADSLLARDALLAAATPFVEDPDLVVATGGTIRAVNGCAVERGQVTEVRLPAGWIARIQVVEYLRAFLLGRAGWSHVGGMLIISGAFGLFRRDLVVAVGGLDPHSLAEDADLVTALHRYLRDRRRPYRVEFLADAVCWTELPPDAQILARQRRRWSYGLAELLWKQRAMIANPRYGRIGLIVLPYFVLFEFLGPVIELAGVPLVALGVAFGLIDVVAAGWLALVAIGFGVGLSFGALLIEELVYHTYPRWRDVIGLMAAAVVENVGYRQRHAWWRLQGTVQALRRKPATWGAMPRRGFTPPA